MQMIIGLAGGGGLTALLNYVRQSRKDGVKARQTDHENSSKTMLKYWSQITEEQRDWRQTLRAEIAVLQSQLDVVRVENASLRGKVAELDAHNADLKRDNEKLEGRVKQLERELDKHTLPEQVA